MIATFRQTTTILGRVRSVLRLAILCALILHQFSCDNNTTCGTDSLVGRVEGYLLSAGEPFQARINISGSTSDYPRFRGHVESDSTGWYSFELPVGEYRLEINTNGPRIRFNEFETSYNNSIDSFELTSGTHRRDIHCGALKYELSAPPELNGMRLSLSLHYTGPLQGISFNQSVDVRNSQAVFDFNCLLPGQVRLSVQNAHFGSNQGRHYWLPIGASEETAALVDIPTNAFATQQDSLPALGCIKGEVHGSWETFNRNTPSIQAWSTDSTLVASTHVNSIGEYFFALFSADTVFIRTEISRLEQWYGGSSFLEATPVHVEMGTDVQLDPMIESGLAINIDDFQDWPSSEFSCSLLRADGTTVNNQALRWHGDPPHQISNVPPGQYFLHVKRSDESGAWCEQYYNHALTLAKATQIEVPPDGQTTSVSLHLIPGGEIAGKVMNSQGRPADWNRVYAIPTKLATDFKYSDWISRDNGTFRIPGLPDGSYLVGVRNSPYTYYYYPGTLNPEEAIQVEIVNQGTIPNLTWSFP
jgi:hypothetical protein